MGSETRTIKTLKEFYEEIAVRHDFALELAGHLSESQLTSICEDLKSAGWRCKVEKGQNEEGESNYVVLIALDDVKAIVAEAERQMTQRMIRT